ncbi:MAG TPA: acetoacetate--CoA ligase [Aestuariivirgaceae bacterium]|nr:acetoacetate--CoA ligase [Aestuariivirgaceae bacterium]
MTDQPIWVPPHARKKSSNLARFMTKLADRQHRAFSTYEALHAYSIAEPEGFWSAVWDEFGVLAESRGQTYFAEGGHMRHARFFPGARLNYAENLLKHSDCDKPAIIFRGEERVRLTLSWSELKAKVAAIASLLRSLGTRPGDRVCAVVPNHPDTIAAFLAVNCIGAVWSSCSPDFGERGILDRFSQIEPKILIACDGYYYNGKVIDISAKTAAVAAKLPTVGHVLLIDYIGEADRHARSMNNAQSLASAIAPWGQAPLSFERMPFDHPIYILFSSGTTGVPKCIVHRAGGVLLKHLTEHFLHTDLKPDDRLFYFTTCGWMMWNWLVSGLVAGGTLLLYDGSPFYPDERALFDFADEEGMTIFGTSAKYLDAVRKTGWRPMDTHELGALRTMCSTGSPLAPESFDFVYAAVKPDLHLASISGGTDICGCFVAGNPLAPVYRGEIQAPTLGVAVDIFDDQGRPVRERKGELVCTRPFPSMPVMFWNDPTGEKYHNAYFARFDNVWCHGDFAEWTSHGGVIIHGRSDATLNPGGVRIGTAEIYAQVEQIPEVAEGLAIGQDWDNDVRIILFVRLIEGHVLTPELIDRIRTQIRNGASPRHVPAKIIAVADIPRTKSGKITELAVRDIVHGREVANREALANPEALDLYRALPELRS